MSDCFRFTGERFNPWRLLTGYDTAHRTKCYWKVKAVKGTCVLMETSFSVHAFDWLCWQAVVRSIFAGLLPHETCKDFLSLWLTFPLIQTAILKQTFPTYTIMKVSFALFLFLDTARSCCWKTKVEKWGVNSLKHFSFLIKTVQVAYHRCFFYFIFPYTFNIITKQQVNEKLMMICNHLEVLCLYLRVYFPPFGCNRKR